MISQFIIALQTLDALHNEIFSLLEVVGADGWNWKPGIPDCNSMYAIANHTILSQYWWIQENLNRVEIPRDRPGEFVSKANDLDSLKKLYQDIQNLTKQILEQISESDLQSLRSVKQREVTVEWIVFHVVEHTALHLGHVQITKQLFEDQQKE